MNPLFAICQKDTRYDIEAYLFLREALEYTVKYMQASTQGPKRHVSGQELAAGFRDYALQQFGPMAFSVLAAWGIHRTEDIGAIVFNLVESGELGKTPDDKPEDFSRGFDFYESFEQPFLPPDPQPGDSP